MDQTQVNEAAERVINAADELRGALSENNLPRIWASNDRLLSRVDALKTELIVLQRLSNGQRH
jgi:hypothetical protein